MSNLVGADRQSIFGDTYQGVPSPNRAYTSLYPNRYHGPRYNYPVFGPRYIAQPHDMPLRQSALTHMPSLGDNAPVAQLFNSTTGYTFLDAAIGAAAGYALAKPSDQMTWALVGGVATGLAGTFGLIATVAAGFYQRNR